MAGYTYDNSLPAWQNYANWAAAGSPTTDANGQAVDVRGQPLSQSNGGQGSTFTPSYQPPGVSMGSWVPEGNWTAQDWLPGGQAYHLQQVGPASQEYHDWMQQYQNGLYPGSPNLFNQTQPANPQTTTSSSPFFNVGSAAPNLAQIVANAANDKAGVAKPPAPTSITPVPPPVTTAAPPPISPASPPVPGTAGGTTGGATSGGQVAVDPSFGTGGAPAGTGTPTIPAAPAQSGLYNTSMESGVNMADAVASVAGHHLGENAVQAGMPGQFASGGQQAQVPQTITSSDGWGQGYGVGQNGWTQYGQGRAGNTQDAGYLYKNLKTPGSIGGGWLSSTLPGANSGGW